MPNTQLYTAISNPRFARYLSACGNNRDIALSLYRVNIALSQQVYGVIGIFEVVLRNSIDRHFLRLKGEEWIVASVEEGGYLEITDGCEDSYHSVQDAILKLGAEYTHDRLIAKLPFGFWAFLFAKKQYAAAGSSLIEVFDQRPFGTKQKDINQNLIKINELRNRVAHYEPICFDGKTSRISTEMVKKRYQIILKMLNWLGCDTEQILHQIDYVPAQ